MSASQSKHHGDSAAIRGALHPLDHRWQRLQTAGDVRVVRRNNLRRTDGLEDGLDLRRLHLPDSEQLIHDVSGLRAMGGRVLQTKKSCCNKKQVRDSAKIKAQKALKDLLMIFSYDW